MSKGVYVQHRQNQREIILEASVDLFNEKGIDLVSFSDIAVAARITRPTLYKYYDKKEDIAEEIFKSIASQWIARNNTDVWKRKYDTGFECVEQFFKAHFQHMLDNLRETQFMAEFNYLYSKHWTVERGKSVIHKALKEDKYQMDLAVRQGLADGSIRSDMSEELLVAAIFNMVSSMLDRIGEFAPKVTLEYDLDFDTVFMSIVQIFLDGIRAR